MMKERNISGVVEALTSSLRNQKIWDSRIENLWIMLIFFYKLKKNIVTTTKLQFFRISGIFLTCFGCFLFANTAEQKHVDLQKFY